MERRKKRKKKKKRIMSLLLYTETYLAEAVDKQLGVFTR